MNVFKLEDYLGKHEFSAPYLLCCSDVETFSQQEVVEMASPDLRVLWENLTLGYTEVPGHPLLRAQIAESLYPSLNADQIFCFAGAEEGIFCSLYTLCESDDHIIVLTPCYQSLMEIPRLKGAHVTEIPLCQDNDWRIDVDTIKKAIIPKTKCIVINFPHNPTGQVIRESELTDLISLCDHHGLWLFSDEVYRLLGSPHEAWASPAVELYPRALSLGVMSKAFGMAGLRIGWIACQDKEILKRIEHMKHYTSICNSASSEILSLISLHNMDKILERNNTIVRENLKIVDAFMKDYSPLFEWVRPQGGCIGFVKYKKKEFVDTFCEKLIHDKGVLLLPASVYKHESNHFRIGFGRRNMSDALTKLREFIAYN